MKILDIACGNRKHKGAFGIDIDPATQADIIGDCTEPLPFENESYDVVYCVDFLEHTFKFDKVLREIHRVLKTNGIAHIEVPYYNSFNYGQVPFHCIPFCETTMKEFFTKEGMFNRYSKFSFKIVEQKLFFTKWTFFLPQKIRIKLAHYLPNTCYQIYWKIQKERKL